MLPSSGTCCTSFRYVLLYSCASSTTDLNGSESIVTPLSSRNQSRQPHQPSVSIITKFLKGFLNTQEHEMDEEVVVRMVPASWWKISWTNRVLNTMGLWFRRLGQKIRNDLTRDLPGFAKHVLFRFGSFGFFRILKSTVYVGRPLSILDFESMLTSSSTLTGWQHEDWGLTLGKSWTLVIRVSQRHDEPLWFYQWDQDMIPSVASLHFGWMYEETRKIFSILSPAWSPKLMKQAPLTFRASCHATVSSPLTASLRLDDKRKSLRSEHATDIYRSWWVKNQMVCNIL